MKEKIQQQLRNQNLKHYRQEGKKKLQGKWFICIGVTFFLMLIPFVLDFWLFVASFIINLLFAVGIANFYLEIIRGEPVALSNLFISFQGKKRFIKNALVHLIFVLGVAIGLFFLIVPGIIFALMFSQVYYITADNHQLSLVQIFKKSFVMTFGKKRQLFCLFCTFIGWFLLGVITLGVGLLYAIPYCEATIAEYHMAIRPQGGNQQYRDEKDEKDRQQEPKISIQ